MLFSSFVHGFIFVRVCVSVHACVYLHTYIARHDPFPKEGQPCKLNRVSSSVCEHGIPQNPHIQSTPKCEIQAKSISLSLSEQAGDLC